MANTCFNCYSPCDEDAYCHGCKEYVCDECGVEDTPFGEHSPEDHLEKLQDGDAD